MLEKSSDYDGMDYCVFLCGWGDFGWVWDEIISFNLFNF